MPSLVPFCGKSLAIPWTVVRVFLPFLCWILTWVYSSVPAERRPSPLLTSAKGSKEWRFWTGDIGYDFFSSVETLQKTATGEVGKRRGTGYNTTGIIRTLGGWRGGNWVHSSGSVTGLVLLFYRNTYKNYLRSSENYFNSSQEDISPKAKGSTIVLCIVSPSGIWTIEKQSDHTQVPSLIKSLYKRDELKYKMETRHGDFGRR